MADGKPVDTGAATKEPSGVPFQQTSILTQPGKAPAGMPTNLPPKDGLKPDSAPQTGMDHTGKSVAAPVQDTSLVAKKARHHHHVPGSKVMPNGMVVPPVVKSVDDLPTTVSTTKGKNLGDNAELNKHRP